MGTIEKDVYIAYHDNDSSTMAIDEYAISQISSGFVIESNSTVFGSNGFYQKSELRTDHKWQMLELRVSIESLSIEMCASVRDGKLYLQQKQQNTNFEKIIDLQNEKYFFMYSGALIIPMIWLRGFNFDNYKKDTYRVLPMGYAEVKQLLHEVPNQNTRDFSLLIYVHNFMDIVKIQTDMSGKLLSLHSETNKITININNKS